MRTFVAGGTGVIGRRAVTRLVAAGHAVTAVARSAERADWLRSAGAIPVTVDLFDAAGVRAAVAGHEAVINLATSIPPGSRALVPGAWKETARLRTEGAANLAAAARAAEAGRFVQESIVLIYADGGGAWLDEDAPIEPSRVVAPVLAAEDAARRVGDAGGVGVALRFGLFIAPEAVHVEETITWARRGVAMTVGDAEDYVPSIQADDAAAAVVAALDLPAGIYNVVDDEPLRRRDLVDAIASALEVPAPRLPPKVLGKATPLQGQARSLRVSNGKLRGTDVWAPAYPSAREAWRDVATHGQVGADG